MDLCSRIPAKGSAPEYRLAELDPLTGTTLNEQRIYKKRIKLPQKVSKVEEQAKIHTDALKRNYSERHHVDIVGTSEF